MSKTKPEKQLVSKEAYLRVINQKFHFQVEAVLAIVLLFPLGLAIAFFFFFNFVQPASDDSKLWCAIVIAFCVGCMLKLCSYSRQMFSKAKAILPVERITPQNAHLLPAQETLLRGSDLPPTRHQAELLRATQSVHATPPEQLLRTTTEEE